MLAVDVAASGNVVATNGTETVTISAAGNVTASRNITAAGDFTVNRVFGAGYSP